MEDLGRPIAYVVLAEGTPVYDRQGERIGVVEHLVGDMTADIFDGVIVHTLPLPGGHLFADVDQIAELREKGVVLSVDRNALHEPEDKAARKKSKGGESPESPLEARLRRAWDWISGRR